MPNSDRPILMTADAVGGVWTYALELTKGLCARGERVLLCVLGPSPSAKQRQAASAISGVELFECNEALEWMDDPWQGVENSGRFLIELAQARRPKLVHLNGYCHAALGFSAPKLVVAHSCVLSWWRAVKAEAAPPKYARYHDAVSRGLNAADLVVAPSRAMLDTLWSNYGQLPKTRVIYNGRDARCESHSEKRPEILCAARVWDEAKNVTTLARAAENLPWPVYVAGEASGTLPRVVSLGRLEPEQLNARFCSAAIYALPALYEPFGLSVLEAAQAGCALVLGDIPTLREIWQDAAIYVDPRDPEALRHALFTLICDSKRRDEFARRASARAAAFTASQMLDRYESAYKSLCEIAPRPLGRDHIIDESRHTTIG